MAIQSPSLGTEAAYVAPAGDSVAWCWKAGDSTETNNDGTIESQVAANPKAGFSIISYTGNLTAGATVGHGLTKAPELFIGKPPGLNNSQIYVYTEVVGNQSTMFLNSNGAAVAPVAGYWNSTSPNDSVITLGNYGTTNGAMPFILYAWAPVEGYSAFGSYTGNANADGVFVYLGFKPALVITKRTNSASSWTIHTAETEPINPMVTPLFANAENAEMNFAGTHAVDFLSNGFKCRGNHQDINSGTMFYAAWSQHPFQSPATAR